MKNRNYLIVNIVIAVVVSVLNYFYQSLNFNFVLKCITSGLFALLAIFNLTYFIHSGLNKKDIKYPLFMVLGAVFCFLGDAFINNYFIIGVVLFALGHVFYVGGYFALEKFKLLDLIIGLGLGLVTGGFVLICPYLSFEAPVLKVACVVYALILSFMVGKTVSDFITKHDTINLLLMIGAILFLISDLCLLICWFWYVKVPRAFNYTCMAVYYPSNLIFAYTIYHYLKTKTNTGKGE